MRFPSLRRHSRFARDLDAYVDGELAHARVRVLEEHLARCTTCARIVEESQFLKRMAAALPEVAAPRSFRLTAAMVAEQPKARPQPVAQRWQLNLVRGAAAVAVVGLFATVTVDLTRGSGSSNTTASGSKAADFESAADKLASGAASGATALSAQSAPAISPALASPAPAVPDAPPRAGAVPSGTAVAIGPGPSNRSSAGTISAGEAAAPAPPQSTPGSGRSTYHIVEAGFAAVLILFAGAALYLVRKERRNFS